MVFRVLNTLLEGLIIFRVLLAILLIQILTLLGCASGTARQVPPGITVANEKMVANCAFKSDFFGSSPFYGLFSGPAINSARQAAFDSAKSLGATHVVIEKIQASRDGTVASGKAYLCPNQGDKGLGIFILSIYGPAGPLD